jgi:hypothetical protein
VPLLTNFEQIVGLDAFSNWQHPSIVLGPDLIGEKRGNKNNYPRLRMSYKIVMKLSHPQNVNAALAPLLPSLQFFPGL